VFWRGFGSGGPEQALRECKLETSGCAPTTCVAVYCSPAQTSQVVQSRSSAAQEVAAAAVQRLGKTDPVREDVSDPSLVGGGEGPRKELAQELRALLRQLEDVLRRATQSAQAAAGPCAGGAARNDGRGLPSPCMVDGLLQDAFGQPESIGGQASSLSSTLRRP
jgi:hypothetical protein